MADIKTLEQYTGGGNLVHNQERLLVAVASILLEALNTGGAVPAGSATLAEQVTQSGILTTMNGNVVSLLNNLVASQDIEILLVRDDGVLPTPLVVQQIREYDQGTGAWATSYETVGGAPYAPTASGANLVYLDPSAVLNLMLTELQGILAQLDVDLSTRASEATLLATNVLLTTIDAILDAIKLDTANLDVALSTVSTEATLAALSAKINSLGQKASAVSTPVVLSAEQEVILSSIDTAVSALDTSTLATEVTLAAIQTLLTTIDGVLDNIKLDTANLDVALSTVATQTTAAAIEANTARNNLKTLQNEADDLVSTFTYLDAGTSDERVNTIVYSSVALATPNVTKTFAYGGTAGGYYVTSITLS